MLGEWTGTLPARSLWDLSVKGSSLKPHSDQGSKDVLPVQEKVPGFGHSEGVAIICLPT